MTETSTGVPTATPTEMTYRVGWEVIEYIPEQQVTIQLRRAEPSPADSDGIPQAVDPETSLRGSSAQITGGAAAITPAVKVAALTALAEMAFREGLVDLLEYPILTNPTGKAEPRDDEYEVVVLIRRFARFRTWFMELAHFGFADIERFMAGWPPRDRQPRRGINAYAPNAVGKAMRSAGVQFLTELAAMIPSLQQYDDTPHLLLRA